jgi:hypothetical protein
MLKAKNSTYRSWQSMKARCYNPNHLKYLDYGGRGITVCEEWKNSFEKFLEDMGEKPDSSYSIERINNDLGYFKENCKWATKKEQSNNRRNCINITINGETLTVTQWAEKLGVSNMTLRNRIKRGWDLEEAVKTKIVKGKDTRRFELLFEFLDKGMSLKDVALIAYSTPEKIQKAYEKRNKNNKNEKYFK